MYQKIWTSLEIEILLEQPAQKDWAVQYGIPPSEPTIHNLQIIVLQHFQMKNSSMWFQFDVLCEHAFYYSNKFLKLKS